MRLAKIREGRSPEWAALFAIFEMDPVLLAQYKREAQAFWSGTEEVVVSEESGRRLELDKKKKRPGLRLVVGGKAKR